MSNVDLSLHDVESVEVRDVKTLPLTGKDSFRTQHIRVLTANGDIHEIALFFTNTGIALGEQNG